LNKTDGEGDSDRTTIVVDKYRVVVSLKDSDLGESNPDSWREVASQVNRHLMRIVSGSTRFVAELLESATRLLRGISALPGSVSRRLDQAHSDADQREQRRQGAVATATTGVNAEDARKEIAAILQKYRIQGHLADIVKTRDGKAVIMILPPDAPEALDVADRAQIAPGSST